MRLLKLHLIILAVLVNLINLSTGVIALPKSSAITQANRIAADQLIKQGTQQYQAGQIQAAMRSWEQATRMYQQLQSRQGEAIALGNLGIAYDAVGDYSKAIELHRQAGKILHAINNRQDLGKALLNLGNSFAALGDYDKAIVTYQQSIKIAQQTKDPKEEGIALGNLGKVYADLGKYDDAIATQEQSLAIAQAINNRSGQARALINLGSVYHSRRQINKARSYYQQALELASRAGERKLQGETLGSLAIVYEDLRDYSKAIEYQEQSLAIAQAIDDPAAQATALNNLGHTLFSAGKLVEAEEKLREAIKLIDSLRSRLNDTNKVSIFDTQVYTYNLLQQILVAAKKYEAALEVSEQGRARAFVELLARRVDNPELNLPPDIEKIRQIARERNATLVEYNIVPDDDFKFRGKQRGREQELFIWVVKPKGEVAFRTVDLKPLWQQKSNSLENLVKTSRESIGANSRGINISVQPVVNQANQKQSLQQLHELLISPIADLLPQDPKEHVIFIPQESLFLVPLSALQDKDGKYLIEKHTILTAPSIQVLSLTRTLKQQRKNREERENSSIINSQSQALIVGNPTMPKIYNKPGQAPQQLPQLPNAEHEALDIAKLLNANALIGKDATKANILQKIPTAKIVHLATHGLLEYGSQSNAGFLQGLDVPGALALAPSGKDDGLLTSSEILNLHLQAELVILSACRTGEGRISGDGVIGLSRSFISAGTESVIVSLWSVPDAQTAKLMKFFYQTIKKNPDKAAALRHSMLNTIKDKTSPYYWAAFTLIGES